ncbi:lanosterol 14-alpha demethylase-like isoform X2 [Halichondria panicea]
MSVFSSVLEVVSAVAVVHSTTVAVMVVVSMLFLYRRLVGGGIPTPKQGEKYPPHISSCLPFLGHAVEFGKNPIEFLLSAREKYGNVFSFTMVGKTFTYLIGSDSSALLFNSKDQDLNAAEVYGKLVTPVFGKGVAYDVSNDVFLEQKKMLKTGLSVAHFRRYVPLIEKETIDYFERWGDSGVKDLFQALSELIILTASRCLHGREIRECLDEHVAQLYSDLDGGFSHLAWLLPGWLPLPSFRKRDHARLEMYKIFGDVIQRRRESSQGDHEDDVLDTLLHTTYKDGRTLKDHEIIGMLIGFLLAGQHTSSTTSAWVGFYLARHKQLQNAAYQEQLKVCGEDLPPLNYDEVEELAFLERCLKETLRLRPPIMTMMRMVKSTQTIGKFTIPPGHQVCVSPTVNQSLMEVWTNPQDFNPDRFLEQTSSDEKFSFVPFGAGRHRCVGESFALIQIKTIWSVLLRKYEFDLVDGHFPPVNYTTMIHTPTKPLIRYRRRGM